MQTLSVYLPISGKSTASLLYISLKLGDSTAALLLISPKWAGYTAGFWVSAQVVLPVAAIDPAMNDTKLKVGI
jgi:hypothetical protein